MSKSMKPLLLSLKPRYADLVFDGLKKVELRRRSPKNMKGRDVFIYVTNPVRNSAWWVQSGKRLDGNSGGDLESCIRKRWLGETRLRTPITLAGT